MMPLSSIPQFSLRKTNDSTLDALAAQAAENVCREISARIVASEPQVLPPAPRVVSVMLSWLVRPRTVNGRMCSVVIRITYAARQYSDRRTEFIYYKDVPEAMASHPHAKVWPFPYAEDRRTPRMEMRQEMHQQKPAA